MTRFFTHFARFLAAADRFLTTTRGSVWLVLLLSALWYGCLNGTRVLMLPDEGRYVGVAWEMLRSGEYLTPTLNGLPYFHKPPLFYWITALALHLFGSNEWAARVASWCGAVLGTVMLYAFVRRHRNLRTANLALGLMWAQPLIFGGAGYANLDMLVAGCIVACIVCLAEAAWPEATKENGAAAKNNPPKRRSRAWLIGAYAFAALGFLAKGLIGIVLPGAVVVGWLLLIGQWRRLRIFAFWPGWLVFAAIALPWPLIMQWRFPQFFNYFIILQHFKRYDGTTFNNVHPWWFYPAILLLAALPLWPALLRQLRHQTAWRAGEHTRLQALLWIWVAVITLFFSLPASKLVGYIFPAVFPLMVLGADALEGTLARRPNAVQGTLKPLWAGVAAAVVVLNFVLLTIVGIRPPAQERALAAPLAQAPADEPIVMVNKYYFSVPFYAALRHPVAVVQSWQDPALQHEDSPRKELADAGQFDPKRAADLLLTPERLPAWLCAQHGGVWVIGQGIDPKQGTFVNTTPRARAGEAAVWHIDMSQPGSRQSWGCAQTYPAPAVASPLSR